jgi:hypothetical protein
MYRITLALGKSSGYEASVEPNNTALEQGKVGLYIGGTTGLNAGLALRALDRCVEELNGIIRNNVVSGLQKVAYTKASDSTAASAGNTGTETTVTAVIAVPDLEVSGRTILSTNAFKQCLEVARELMNSGVITGIKP